MVCFLWFIAAYEVTDTNWNLAWAWPTHLIAAAILLWRPASKRLSIYMGTTAGIAVLFVTTAPVLPQDFHEAVYPLVLAIAVRTGWRAVGGGRDGVMRDA